jgi:hypothetical protein
MPIITLESDTTLRWSCRAGDFLIWFRCNDPFCGPEDAWTVMDLWEMREGDSVTITNRIADLPGWFALHPSEVSDALACQMMANVHSGYQPGDPIDGPNLWRLRAGDRVIWIGDDRPGQPSTDGLLAILDCRKCAVVIGESNRSGFDDYLTFGVPTTEEPSPVASARGRQALETVQAMGIPRTLSTDWTLSHGSLDDAAYDYGGTPTDKPSAPSAEAEAEPATYTVIVADNFHYMDESESDIVGQYTSITEAVAACKLIVEKSLQHEYRPRMSADDLYDRYKSFGDDPFIRGPGAGRTIFSAWEYAKARCREICEV